MRTLLVTVLMFASHVLAEEPKKMGAAQTDLKKLQGTWEGYAVEGSGERPGQGPVHLRLIIEDQKIRAIDLGSAQKDREMGSGSFTLDPGKAVKEIDATGIVLPGKREKTYPGIYEIDGDTFKWCVDNRSQERPSEFRTAGGKYLLILKRVK